ncbi:tRNA (adenosine(37)-N6)-threonylcarbamoyltransferase complex transferase subunit TsaD, partial [Candidatus Amesbacteria bacterium]|nr:tRNA (adenosine(37)-N6)-threonylcarbamoyltransferase complex transferase subunit TsaD [Candidatus Amesbacteria bacterium]
MKILAIETSCDETAAAVTRGTQILASVKWTQEVHARFGGVVPSLAKRAHEERIESIINQAMSNAKSTKDDIGAIAVTVGPGLAMALEVGIKWAKKLAQEWHKPLIGVNHIEGHILSVLASISPSSVPPLK